MNYQLQKASQKDISKLTSYKLNTIFEYARKLEDEEYHRILEYVQSNVPLELNQYQIIVVDGIVVGSLLLTEKDNHTFLDEIYLEESYRNKGIGKDILKNILSQYDIVYLWVYQSNQKAISLYKKLGFQIVEKTETRYCMEYNKSKKEGGKYEA